MVSRYPPGIPVSPGVVSLVSLVSHMWYPWPAWYTIGIPGILVSRYPQVVSRIPAGTIVSLLVSLFIYTGVKKSAAKKLLKFII